VHEGLTTVRVLGRLVAAAALAAAAGLAVPAPAQAVGCPTATGVTVVVDFGAAGGGIQSSCVPGGAGDSAAELFEVDHELTRVTQYPGAVCKVDGKPGSAGCSNMPPSDAYWGLFWSDGSGGWSYSSQGVDGLEIPDGGSVGFAWQDGGGNEPPGVPPASHGASSPSPDPQPSDPPSSGGSGSSGGVGNGGGNGGGGDGSSTGRSDSPSAPPSASPGTADNDGTGKGDKPGKTDKTDKPGKKGDDKTGEDRSESDEPVQPESSESADAATTADPPDAGEDGLPAWVAPVGIGVLFAAAGVVALVRRRATP
jgi:hypothetical protein